MKINEIPGDTPIYIVDGCTARIVDMDTHVHIFVPMSTADQALYKKKGLMYNAWVVRIDK